MNKPQIVSDLPAERGINITNILLAALIVLGSIFGTVATNYMGSISDNVVDMTESISEIKIFNGEAGIEILNIKDDIQEIKGRVDVLEGKVK